MKRPNLTDMTDIGILGNCNDINAKIYTFLKAYLQN